MMAIWRLALSFVLAAPTTAASPVEMPPTPAEQVLRAIVSADVTRQTLQAAIRRCATRAPRPKTCETELPIVLAEFARSGVPERALTLQALDSALKEAEEPAARQLRELRVEIQKGVSPQRAAGPKEWFLNVAEKEGPPSRSDEGRLPQPVFKARLLAYLDRMLSEDPDVRVQQALEAATADSCEAIYGGKVLEVCTDLGLWRLQWASLWLAVMDLRTSHGEEELINRYRSVPRQLLEAALRKGELSSDEGLSSYMHVLRRWMEQPPTRWKAWLDVEELLGPR
jgi:hypothetical protein